jgi:dimethylhistidine N-methyltransferase
MYRDKEITPLEEIKKSLLKPVRQIPSKYFYDEKGSRLFDKICLLDEYYLTRTEIKIMRDNINDIISGIPKNTLLVELGSGSGIKTKLLLSHLKDISAYIPMDISQEYLFESCERLRDEFQGLPIYPLASDFTKLFLLPEIKEFYSNTTFYFPGSTLGNLTPAEAKKLIDHTGYLCGNNGTFLIGVDLVKDYDIIENAYNDKEGVTAEFNLNILSNVNNETGSDFIESNFRHHAFFNSEESRIEMHLVSNKKQTVHLNGDIITIEKDESILTEYSYKYSVNMLKEIIRDSFYIDKMWTDVNSLFGLFLLRR